MNGKPKMRCVASSGYRPRSERTASATPTKSNARHANTGTRAAATSRRFLRNATQQRAQDDHVADGRDTGREGGERHFLDLVGREDAAAVTSRNSVDREGACTEEG